MLFEEIHKNFCLNGIDFSSKEALLYYTKNVDDEIYEFTKNWLNDKDHVIVQTSGSTGKPKQIKIQKVFMINSALATGKYFNLLANTSALLCLSPKYIAGKMMLVRAMVLGWQLDVIEPKSNPFRGEKQYDFSAVVPMQLYHSLADLHKIKTIIVGGGAVSKSLQEKLQKLKTNIFATYGMTETITHIAVKKLNKVNDEKQYFEVLPNVTISKDERDCLVIDALKIAENQTITNDLVEIINKNKFKWLGRFDNIINSGGIKISPEIVEEELIKIINQRFFITSKKDSVLGEKLILIIEGKADDKLKEKLQKEILQLKTISKYEKPKSIYFIDRFIETETQKINRKETLGLLSF
jgi:O-succinylbenzoic acid--CoA ligase